MIRSRSRPRAGCDGRAPRPLRRSALLSPESVYVGVALQDLAGRIGSNHLRGRIRQSTFRLTLEACLTTPLGLTRVDSKHLDNKSEQG